MAGDIIEREGRDRENGMREVLPTAVEKRWRGNDSNRATGVRLGQRKGESEKGDREL